MALHRVEDPRSTDLGGRFCLADRSVLEGMPTAVDRGARGLAQVVNERHGSTSPCLLHWLPFEHPRGGLEGAALVLDKVREQPHVMLGDGRHVPRR